MTRTDELEGLIKRMEMTDSASIDKIYEFGSTLADLQLEHLDQKLINRAFTVYSNLLERVWTVDLELMEPYSKLAALHSKLVSMRDSGMWKNDDIRHIQNKVSDIEAKWVRAGKFLKPGVPDNIEPLQGQAFLFELLHHIHRLTHWMLAMNDPVNVCLKPIHERLMFIHAELNDIQKYKSDGINVDRVSELQGQLDEIDSMRREQLFLPPECKTVMSAHDIPEGKASRFSCHTLWV